MDKQEFLAQLCKELSGLPREETEERLSFYSEMIDDAVEEGQIEEQAICDIGSVQEIASQIIREIPLSRIAKERRKTRRRIGVLEIILLALGAPIWISLAIAVFAVILSLYIVLWSLVISVWAVFLAVAVSAVVVFAAGIFFAVTGYGVSGLFVAGAGLLCAGLSIFLFLGARASTKGVALLTKSIALGIKKLILKRREHDE